MKINRQELIEALTNIKPGIAAKEIMEQSTHFSFSSRSIQSYNDEIAITCAFQTGLKGAVKAAEFFDLINKYSAEELDIENGENCFIITVGKSKANINIDSEIKLPKLELNKIKTWTLLPNNFCEAIIFCSFSTADNITIPAMGCLNAEKEYIISCDNLRATRMKLDKRIKESFLLPVNPAKELVKANPTHYFLDDNWIHFKNENGLNFSCRIINEDYPPIGPLFDEIIKYEDNQKIELPEQLSEAVSKASIFAKNRLDKGGEITLKFTKNKLTCRGEGDLGWFEETYHLRYSGKAVKVNIIAEMLLDILNRFQTIIIGETKVFFKGENFDHIISLI